MSKQINSKKRVADYGEVFTSEREVNAMLDLVKQETERIDSRFLEPACGTGNFLREILERKLRVVESRYRKSQPEYEKYLVIAASSIYGIDILEDNVMECRRQLFEIIQQRYRTLFKHKVKADVERVIQYILEHNIIHGDALDLRTVGEHPQPIKFSEWSFHGKMVKRRDFTFSSLLPDHQPKEPDLFSANLISDRGEEVFIPTETRSYPPVHFLKLGQEYDWNV